MSSLSTKPVVQNVDHVLLLNETKKIAKRIDDNGLRDFSFNQAKKAVDKYPEGETVLVFGNSSAIYSSSFGRILILNQNQGNATLFDLSSNGSFSCRGFSNSQLLTLDLLRQWQINDDPVHEFLINCTNGNKIFIWLNERAFV